MKRALTILFLLLLTSLAYGNGVSLNSPGTRALAMGGAYTTFADDYSAPYWNPAGLQKTMGVQFSLFVTDIIPLASYKYTLPASAGGAAIDAKTKTNHYIAPNAALLWTCKLSDKMRMGLSFIVPAGLGTEWDGADLLPFNGPAQLPVGGGNYATNLFANSKYEWMSQLAVWNLSLSAAYKWSDRVNVGGAIHLVRGDMEMARGVDAVSNINPAAYPTEGLLDSQYEEESAGWGVGYGFGVQFMPNEVVTFAAAARTRMRVDFEGEAKITNANLGQITKFDFDRDITWPFWLAGGMGVKASEKLQVAADFQWSQWKVTQKYLLATHDTTHVDTLKLLWEDAVQIRFGGEYRANQTLALRAGFYVDPAPGPDKTQTILIPNTDFLGFTFGAGLNFRKLTIDVTLEYLKGSERDIEATDVLPGVGMPGKHGVNIWAPSLALTYKL